MQTREEIVAELAEMALGTCESEAVLAYRLGDPEIDEGQIADLLLDLNVECCPDCGWWTNSHELILADDGETAIGCYACLDDPELCL